MDYSVGHPPLILSSASHPDQGLCGAMTSHHTTELDYSAAAAAAAPDTVSSTPHAEHPPPPPARWHPDDPAATARVRLMCSFGGRILPRPGDQQLRYVGGETRIVAVPRAASFATLLAKLCKLSGLPPDSAVKYQLPSEDLDALISVSSDEDVDNMMDEFERLAASSRAPRLRIFLFPPSSSADSPTSSSSSKRDSWFFDALNGRAGAPLERGCSEASSVLSELPDYLFGLDSSSDEPKPAASLPQSSDLPPAKTETPETPDVDVLHGHAPPVYVHEPAPPLWQYVHEPVPVYYMPGGSLPVRPVPMPVQYMPQQLPAAQAAVGYAQPTRPPVYIGAGLHIPTRTVLAASYEYPVTAADHYDAAATSGGLARNPVVVPPYAVAAADTPAAVGPEIRNIIGRASQC